MPYMNTEQILQVLRDERDKVDRALAALTSNEHKPRRYMRHRSGMKWTPERLRKFQKTMRARRIAKQRTTHPLTKAQLDAMRTNAANARAARAAKLKKAA